jgi:hypothetical protein
MRREFGSTQMEISITRGKSVKILRIFAKFLNNPDFISWTKQRIILQLFREMLSNISLKSFFKFLAFGPLMIDFYTIQKDISDVGGFFIREDNFIKPVQISGEKRQKRQNSRDRNMSIISFSTCIHCEKFGIKGSKVDNPWNVDFTGCESV